MLRVFKRTAITALLITAACAAFLWHSLPGSVHHDAPRVLPWQLPDYRQANTGWHIGDDGRIYTHVEHLPLPDIRPEMVAWFYQQLPISTVQLGGETLPLYHIFHPSEHGQIEVIQAAPSGIAGMTAGAVIQRKEWFGPFDSQGAARIEEFSDAGMLAIPEFLGLPIGEVRHRFWQEDGFTAYEVDSIIGSTLPVVGPLINWYLREQVFHPAMLEQWRRHQVQEVSSLQFFLAQLYAQRNEASNNHFSLASNQ